MSKDRFDLEQEILDCWNITTDLNDLYEYVMEVGNDRDIIANVLLGLKQMYDIKFDRTFRTFEESIRRGEFKGYPPERKDPDLNWD